MSTLVAPFREVAAYRELLKNLTRRELYQRYRGSMLGALWSFLLPLSFIAAYTFVFTFIFKVVEIEHYPIFLLCGQVTWLFFSGAIGQCASSLTANAGLIQKVRFPKLVVPLAIVLANLVNFAVLLVLLLALIIGVHDLHSTLALLPLLIVLLAAVTLGFGMILAVANVYFRDVEHFLTTILLPWFFLTPVFYSIANPPKAADDHSLLVHALYYGNFIAPFVENFRRVAFDGVVPSAGQFAYMTAVAAGMLIVGIWMFHRFGDDLAAEL